MINLRYHVVSITAVFLALGIGIAMGSSFLGSAAVDQVDQNISAVRREAATARAERDVQRDEVARLEDLQAEMMAEGPPTQFTSDLTEQPVILLTVGGVDEASLEALRIALESSEAAFDGVLRVNDKIIDDGSAEELAAVVGAPEAKGDELRDELVDAVATELTEHGVVVGAPDPSDPTTTVPGTDPGTTDPGTTDPGTTDPGTTVPGSTTVPGDPGTTTVPGDPGAPPTVPEEPDDELPAPTVIRGLVEAGFLTWEPTDGGPVAADLLAGGDYRYVVVTGAEPEVADADLLLPVIEAMAAEGPAPVVLGSAVTGDDPEVREAVRERPVAAIRDDDVLRARVSTVDDLEVFAGVAAVIGAVGDLAEPGRGHYGLGEDRDSLLPPP